MPREFSRARRIAELLQRELATLILRELKDPRLGMPTVTAVDLSRDLSNAKVFVTALGSDDTVADTLKALNRAAGFLRSCLGKRLDMRGTPKLHFQIDASVKRGAELSNLIDQAVASDTKTHSN
ncbi:MAG TPA: 30S ribosome-binding factor RbfA [Acidiferrobacteraceae bacterium]|nr:30S ribosome-binding factor RbfA [Acidiferrobacteraceae bacterium]